MTDADDLLMAAAPYDWRRGLYWLKVADPTREESERHDDDSVIWSHCFRCGGRAGVALPGDLGEVARLLRAIVAAHRHCKQTVRGARWELLVTLRLRQWALLGIVPQAGAR